MYTQEAHFFSEKFNELLKNWQLFEKSVLSIGKCLKIVQNFQYVLRNAYKKGSLRKLMFGVSKREKFLKEIRGKKFLLEKIAFLFNPKMQVFNLHIL